MRPGYRPPEDVEVYKNRTAEAWKSRGSGGVPGAEGLHDEQDNDADVAAKTKNAKRREAKKRAKAAAASGDAGDENAEISNTSTLQQAAPQQPESNGKGSEHQVSPETQVQADQDKKIKRLKKRLREARELQAKKEKGEGLLHEQLEKVIKINELMRDLEKLGVGEEES